MAQPGNYTPILLYGSSTPTNVPLAANLTNSATGSEIAINVADKNLFFKDSGGTVNTVPIRQSSTSSNGWLSSTDWNTFNNKAPAGAYLTAVTADSPLSGAGTSASHLVIAQANTSTSGYLSSTDWNTFNGKQAALVSGTNIKTVGGVTLLGSGDVGTIGVGYGGTGLTTLTAGYIPYGNGTSAFASSANLYFNGTKLGIGTSSPSYDFTVVSTAQVAGGFTGSNVNGMVVKFASTSTNGHDYGIGSNFVTATGELAIYDYTAGATRVYIGGTGGVSIGNTTDPGATNLSVTGAIIAGPTSVSTGQGTFYKSIDGTVLSLYSAAAGFSGYNLLINTARAANAGFDLIQAQANGVTQFRVTGAGVIYAQNIVIQSLSDNRLKENVVNAKEGLDVITALRPVRFDWKLGYGNDRKNQLGFIAQEMEAVFPEAVDTQSKVIPGDDTVYKTVGPSALIPVLVKALQELNDKFDAYVASHP
jgi:hypothetical protein